MRRFLFIVAITLLLCATITSTGCNSRGALFTYENENGPAGPVKVDFLPLGFGRAPCIEPEPEPEAEAK